MSRLKEISMSQKWLNLRSFPALPGPYPGTAERLPAPPDSWLFKAMTIGVGLERYPITKKSLKMPFSLAMIQNLPGAKSFD